MPQTPSEILARMRSFNPSSPRLVWHGREGRIELSGRVFDNWVAKTSNLLVDELDAVSGTSVDLDLPAHWKSIAVAFACWQVGCVAVLRDAVLPGAAFHEAPEGPADIVMTSRTVPAVEAPRLLVCVALGSLALGWDGPLPPGAVDFAAEVRAHGDVYFDQAGDGEDALLVRSAGQRLTAGDLTALVVADGNPGAVSSAAPESAPTLLLEPGTDLLHALAAAISVWREDGALVLVEEGVPVTERLMAGERITGRLAPA